MIWFDLISKGILLYWNEEGKSERPKGQIYGPENSKIENHVKSFTYKFIEYNKRNIKSNKAKELLFVFDTIK